MKSSFLIYLITFFPVFSFGQVDKQIFVTSDVENFWTAYDKIIKSKDSAKQYQFLQQFYIDKSTPGLKGLIEIRNYTRKEFIDAINLYPRFWQSFKQHTESISGLFPEIETDISKLKSHYPNLKPAVIYFTIGAFRSNGGFQNNKVIIGSELALADSSTVIDEFPAWRQSFYKEYHPRKNLALLATHEYIHTQQKEMVENLLSMCLYEGVAEFISCLASGKKSATPAIEFGKTNKDKVVKQYVADLFTMSNNNNWLWGENRNELRVRDLGYFIGYEISERYYKSSADKKKAIVELIELDYTNEKEVERIVNSTKLLPKTLDELNKSYEKQRPKVVSIRPFANGSKNVKPGLTKITLTFSAPLNGYNTGIDFGPLGEATIPVISKERTWSKDLTAWTFEADLRPNKHYQLLISNNFRTSEDFRLKPYLIEFFTSE